MRRNLCIGILREAKESERRAPLTPQDVRWLVKRGVRTEVESSHTRVFKDIEYKKSGAKILGKVRNASLLLGIKEPQVEDLYDNRIYMLFSHTTKGQFHNMPLLKSILRKKTTLIDYEKIVDRYGKRLVYFGRFAGICGAIDALHYFGKKLEADRIKNPFSLIKPTHKYNSLKSAKQAMTKLGIEIKEKGLASSVSPFIIGITGHGNVSGGVQEMLSLLHPIEVHPKDMLRFVQRQRGERNKVYKIVFLREEKLRAKNGKGFYFEEYLSHPERFNSNLDRYLQYLNILIHTSYWDGRYPRMVTKATINKLAKRRPFRLKFIEDISCDINGSIELTHKAATPDNPVFTYIPKKKAFIDGYEAAGISVSAVDNLPSELPADASMEFSLLIRDYVYQIAAHGVTDITHHAALPTEVRKAVIAQQGKLTKNFSYLRRYI
jgi:alpha-aminoadipic semialdehyde synthase